MKYNFIHQKNDKGFLKTDKEKENELELILNMYRRNNILLQDKLFNYEQNLIPMKDELITNLKERIKKLDKQINILNGKKWW